MIGLSKTEVILSSGPLDEIEFTTIEWVWWFNHHRLLAPHRPRALPRMRAALSPSANSVEPLTLSSPPVSDEPGAVQMPLWSETVDG